MKRGSPLGSWFERRRLERLVPNPRSAMPSRDWHTNRSQRYWRDVRRTILARMVLLLCLWALAVAVHKAPHAPPRVLQYG